MNVFALCAGRTASTAFSSACSHLQGFTAGHETRSRLIGGDRLAYPDNHIEIDNRLAWFLGGLDERFGNEARYVYMNRDAKSIAMSYEKRWNLTVSVVRAFATGLCMQSNVPRDRRIEICDFYVHTLEQNVKHFLASKQHVFQFHLNDAKTSFEGFCDFLGVTCPPEAMAEWDHRHNLNRSNLGWVISGGPINKIKRVIANLPAYLADV
jgi:hypothetical protein